MREVGELMILQVEDGDSVSAGFGEDDFGLVKHAHGVHRCLEEVFEENGPVFVDMRNPIFAVPEQS